MNLIVTKDAETMGQEAARLAAEQLKRIIASKGEVRLLIATGASQFTVLSNLADCEGVDWSVVDAFHLDEYVGIAPDHPASFCRYLKERFVNQVSLRSFHFLRGDRDIATVVAQVNVAISVQPIDLAMVGIGENAHLAFNDPPADFETQAPYIVVELDEACRQQQVGEGWFSSLNQVPTHAISMSIQQIMKSHRIICSVPDARKAQAVHDCFEGEVSNLHPASILQRHAAATLLVDLAAASMLSNRSLEAAGKIVE